MTNRLQVTANLCLKISTGFVVVLIFTLRMLSLEAYVFRNNIYCVRNAAYDDVYLSNEQLALFEAKFKLACLILCDQNEQCHSISYNSRSMMCQHFFVSFWDRQDVTGTNESGWFHYDPFKAWDCTDMKNKQYTTGIYTIFPGNTSSIMVKCEMGVDGGGWTVIQQRFDGTVDFQRTWVDYKTGFGDLKGEFWLGNDQIHAITSSADYELRIDISDWHGNSWYAVYKTFKVGDENSQYVLTITNYSGNAGDSMSWHSGMNFSTMDRDNDASDYDCSKNWGGNGGWWYNDCDHANLNSLYGRDIGEQTGIEWEGALGKGISTIKNTRMMIRQTSM